MICSPIEGPSWSASRMTHPPSLLARSHTQSIFLDLFGDPATNPKGWEMLRLQDVLSMPLRNGLSPSHVGKITAKVLTLSAITGSEFDDRAWKVSTFRSPPPSDQSVDENDGWPPLPSLNGTR